MKKGYSARKAKARQLLKDVLERREVNLFDEILDTLPDLRPNDRADVLLRLIEYTTPKLRTVEVQGMPAANVNVNVANLTAPLQERGQFRQLLENPDTLAAVRLLDSRLDTNQTALVQLEPNNKISSLDTNPLDGSRNGSHPVEGAPPDRQTNQPKTIEIVPENDDPSKKL